MQTLAGHIIDEDNLKNEVWLDKLDTGTIDHVYVMYGGSQQADFPYQQPRADNELEIAAQMLAANPLLRIVTLPLLIMED